MARRKAPGTRRFGGKESAPGTFDLKMKEAVPIEHVPPASLQTARPWWSHPRQRSLV